MKTNSVFSIIAVLMLCLTLTPFQAQAQQPSTQSNTASGSVRSVDEAWLSNLVAQARPQRRAGFALMSESYVANLNGTVFNITPAAAGPNLTVVGGGSLGRMTKWTGFTSSNSFIGDSTIFESKAGLVGIGTDSPTSKLTVAGTIESTSGGIQFPDGSVQTTSAAGALFGVAHDATLTGNGTAASPLGVAVPLVLSGAGGLDGLIQATNTSGDGVLAKGGDSPSGFSGFGVVGRGGESINGIGGGGVVGFGGFSTSSQAGVGVGAAGGSSTSGAGGYGVFAQGGGSGSGSGGYGVFAQGGVTASGSGGSGVFAQGAFSSGAGQSGGIGIEAAGGVAPTARRVGWPGNSLGMLRSKGMLGSQARCRKAAARSRSIIP